MRHATCRRRLAVDPHDPTVRAHLDGCAACAAHAERLRAVVDAAPHAAPTPPEGLADGVMSGVRDGGPVTLGATAPAPASRIPRRAIPALAAAAVVLVALAAGALVLRDDDAATISTAAPDVALAAATEATAADTFRFTVEGTHELHVRLPAVPRVGSGQPLEAPQIDFTTPEDWLQGLPPELAEQMRERFRQAGDRLQDHLGSVSVPELRVEPAAYDTVTTYSAEGAVDLPGRARADGTIVSEGGPNGDTVRHDLGIVVVDGTTYVRDGDGWVRLVTGNTPLPTPVVDPRASFDTLVHDAGPVEDLGLEELDGETVRHLRVTAPRAGELFGWVEHTGDPTPDRTRLTTDVWIGEDDVIRQVRTHGHIGDEQMPVSVDIDLTLRITDVGEPVDIDPPPADRVRDGEFPFGFGFGFFLDVSAG